MQNAPLVGLWERENCRTFAAEIQTLFNNAKNYELWQNQIFSAV